MTPLLFALFALSGGIGATLRFIADGAFRSRFQTALPWATGIINATGSFALGLVSGIAMNHFETNDIVVIVCVGVLGGYTTFSSASYETVQLMRQGRYVLSLVHSIGMLTVCVACVAIGLVLGAAV